MSKPTQLTRTQMEQLLNLRCPNMSPATRLAALSGSVLSLGDESFQAPLINQDQPTHRVEAVITKVNGVAQWN